jgi:eukaryotic-like serine/threonine-protein kinase
MITDLGLARRVEGDSSVTLPGAVLGTPSYMSPEQASGQGKRVTTAADIYGLGAILYELLTSRPPFKAATPLDTLMQVRQDEPVLPSRLRPGVSRDLEVICLKCLEKDPVRRYASAEALAEDLERWLAGKPIQARATSVWERGLKWVKRRPAIAALSAISLLVTVLGFGLVTWQWQEATTNAAAEATAREEANSKGMLAQAQLARAEINHYFNQIALADLAWSTNSVERANRMLEDCSPELRGWEWFYLKRLSRGGSLIFTGHTEAVYSVAFSPDGKHLASVSADATVRVWDAAAGSAVLTLRLPGGFYRLAFSKDGKYLAAGGPGKLMVWETSSGKSIYSFNVAQSVSMAFSPDGSLLASGGSSGEVTVWEMATGKRALPFKNGQLFDLSVAFTRDGKRLAAGGTGGIVKIWEVSTRKELLTVKHRKDVYAIAFSPDGTKLASGDEQGLVKVWDTRSGEEHCCFSRHTGTVYCVAFSPDGKRIASASAERPDEKNNSLGKPGQLEVWDAATSQELFALKGHSHRVYGVAFHPDGQLLASASHDRTVREWDEIGSQATPLLTAPHGWDFNITFSPDGQRLACTGICSRPGLMDGVSTSDITLWDMNSRQVALVIPTGGMVTRVAFSRDGRWLAAGAERKVHIWDARTGNQVLAFERDFGQIWCVAFSPDSKQLALGGRGGHPSVSEVSTIVGLACSSTSQGPFAAASALISETSRGEGIRIWDVAKGRESEQSRPLHGQGHDVTSIAFSPDGTRLAWSSTDQTVKVWHVPTGQELFSLRGGQVSFSPDGKRLATASKDGNDQAAKVWDMESGREIFTLRGHAGPIWDLAFHRDGKRLATASGDRTVMIWDMSTGQQVLTLDGAPPGFASVAFSPDGNHLAGAFGYVRIWSATPLSR